MADLQGIEAHFFALNEVSYVSNDERFAASRVDQLKGVAARIATTYLGVEPSWQECEPLLTQLVKRLSADGIRTQLQALLAPTDIDINAVLSGATHSLTLSQQQALATAIKAVLETVLVAAAEVKDAKHRPSM